MVPTAKASSPASRAVFEAAAHLLPGLTVRPTGVRVQASSNRAALIALARDPLVIKDTRIDAAYGLVNLITAAFEAAGKLERPRLLALFGAREAILFGHGIHDLAHARIVHLQLTQHQAHDLAQGWRQFGDVERCDAAILLAVFYFLVQPVKESRHVVLA